MEAFTSIARVFYPTLVITAAIAAWSYAGSENRFRKESQSKEWRPTQSLAKTLFSTTNTKEHKGGKYERFEN